MFSQPTGNACINFSSPNDADAAIEKYNNQELMDRAVRMRRL
jgi:RNA recognition motif-containing protein